MANILGSARDIRKITKDLLMKTDAYGSFPTPIDEIVNAAGLIEVEESLFDDSLLSRIPSFLKSKIDKLTYKVLAAIDRREKKVYINHKHGSDGSLAFRRLHEVSHDILPWQSDIGYADDNNTLHPSVRNIFEQEANFGAAELLFQNNQFTLIAHDYQVSLSSVIELSQTVGSSIHAATRRYVGNHSIPMTTIILKKQTDIDPNGCFFRNEIITSDEWVKIFPDIRIHFPKLLEISKYNFLQFALAAQSRPNIIIEGDIDIEDSNGETKYLKIEAFNNTYNIIVLIWMPTKRMFQRAKRILAK